MSFSHSEARQLINEGFRRVFAREPSRSEAQCVQAVGWLESGYGAYWREAGVGSNNWGAITAPKSWTGSVFAHRDSRPNDDGSSTWYVTNFKVYPTAIAGVEDLVRTVYVISRRAQKVLPAASRGDTYGFSTGLYDTIYYTGFGPTRETRIDGHHRKVLDACNRIALEIGEPMPDGSDPVPLSRTLRVGMAGADVRALQVLLGVTADGAFGPKTHAALIEWQRQRGLKPDGVWGPVSKAAAK